MDGDSNREYSISRQCSHRPEIKESSDAGSLLRLDTAGITLAKKSIQAFVSKSPNHG
jgi:hypothetical protein